MKFPSGNKAFYYSLAAILAASTVLAQAGAFITGATT